jgi:hypothetical protein
MNLHFSSTLAGLALGTMALLPLAAQAQHLHDGDIEISTPGGKLTVSGNHAWHWDGGAVFEGDLDSGLSPYVTDDPGYDSDAGTFLSGTVVRYAALGNLQFWGNGAWSAMVPNNESIKIVGKGPGETTFWTTSGATGAMLGAIGKAGASGSIHSHLTMSIGREGIGAPATGAYLIQMQLMADGYTASTPYYLALNLGLGEEDFETAVGALAMAPIPEPQTWALMLAGLAATGLVLRRRR